MTKELNVIREEALSRAFDSLYERLKRYAKEGEDNLSDGINKRFVSSSCGCRASSRELNCHTVYVARIAYGGGLPDTSHR
jgi:hypothetical protein